ncbi:MAG: transcriptional regulator [Pseudomonadales bacterium]|nr:transcriptional regulator [Pseudomonadales bacterium]
MSLEHSQIRRWVTDKFLSDYYQVSRVTIWAWAKSGRLPPPEKLGPNTTRWDFKKIIEAEEAA